jgi:leader peptidase (prepilin peptidase)/N-methyltransferase
MGRLAVVAFHSILFSFLMVATFCDFDRQMIPLSITITGTIVGLVGSVLMPWPWPYTPAEVKLPGDWRFQPIPAGVYPWPVWGPLPGWLAPGGNWPTGLVTGLAGAFVGTMILRLVRFLFGFGRGAEFTEPEDPETAKRAWPIRTWSWLGRVGGRALGLGDADLMMMAGSFLGWQMTIVAFFVAVVPGLIMGLVQMAMRGNQPFAFGPALAAGVVITWLCWPWLGPQLQVQFFDSTLMTVVGGMCAVFMLAAGYSIRLMRLLRV